MSHEQKTIDDPVLSAQCSLLEEQFGRIIVTYLNGPGVPIEDRIIVIFNVLCAQAAKLAHATGKHADDMQRMFGDGVKEYKERLEKALVSKRQNG